MTFDWKALLTIGLEDSGKVASESEANELAAN
jgi:hypothetical protein